MKSGKTLLKRVTSAGLALLTAASVFPASAVNAFAATSTSTLKTVQEMYVDATDGKQIAKNTSYTETMQQLKPQSIANYEYVDYEQSIEYVYEPKDINYIIGYPNGTVRPEGNLTRAEAITIMYRLFDGEYPEATRGMSASTFKDVSKNDWFYEEVRTLYDLDIIDGTNGYLNPNTAITRAELAKMVAKFKGLDYKGNKSFDDLTKEHWAYSYILAVAEIGWVKGYDDNTFKPDNAITRAETITLINNMINRKITLEQLDKLGVKNPYSDLNKTHWAYTQIIEATVKHSGEEWHGMDYNDGKLDVIVEKFVDTNGKELAKTVTSSAKAVSSPKAIPAFSYAGRIVTYVYKYSNGDALPSIEKTANVKTATVGETLTYTVTAGNAELATVDIKNTYVEDTIPAGLEFVRGSVMVAGKTTTDFVYNPKNRLLTIQLGNIAPETEVTATFEVKVTDEAYGKIIKNTAILKSDNAPETPATDGGVTVGDGKTKPSISKTANKKTASVGDKITYTLTAKNDATATVALENVVLTDTIPSGLTFQYGSATVGGKPANDWNYDEATRLLTVKVGDIAVDSSVAVTFVATVNDTAYGKTIENVGIMTSDNGNKVLDGANTNIDWSQYSQFTGIFEGEYGLAINYFVGKGVLSTSDFATLNMTANSTSADAAANTYWVDFDVSDVGYLRLWASGAQLNALLANVTGSSGGYSSTSLTKRIDFAKTYCVLSGRDAAPNTNGLSIKSFKDVSNGTPTGKLIAEVSNNHYYELDANNNERWFSLF